MGVGGRRRARPGDADRAEFIRLQIGIAQRLAHVEHWARTPSDRPGGTRADGGPAGAALAEADILMRREDDLLADEARARTLAGLVSPWRPVVTQPYAAERRHPVDHPLALVRRGFAAELRAPLVFLLGGECPACGGVRLVWDIRNGTQEVCRACDGRRLRNRLGELFATQPVERVMCPGVVRRRTVYRGTGAGDISPDHWDELGIVTCVHLGGVRCPPRTPAQVGAGTHAHMTDETLSRLLVAHGRHRADLPPLTARRAPRSTQ